VTPEWLALLVGIRRRRAASALAHLSEAKAALDASQACLEAVQERKRLLEAERARLHDGFQRALSNGRVDVARYGLLAARQAWFEDQAIALAAEAATAAEAVDTARGVVATRAAEHRLAHRKADQMDTLLERAIRRDGVRSDTRQESADDDRAAALATRRSH
jgi:hypothetical protein